MNLSAGTLGVSSIASAGGSLLGSSGIVGPAAS